MKKKRPKISTHIYDGGKGLAEIMRDKLTAISQDMITQVMSKARRLTPSQKLQALKGLTPRGVLDYKDALKTALSVMSLDALDHVRLEIPKAKNVRFFEALDSITLAEFDKLPTNLQKKIKTQTNLLVGKQIGDLQKIIEFAYTTAEEETDSMDQVQADLNDSAIGWLDSTSMEAGAELTAANTINSARSAFFFEPDVLEQIEAFQFNNNDPVTPICEDLAGKIFGKDEPSMDFWPPLHWNCKSYITVVLVGNLDSALKKSGQDGIEKLKPSKASLEDDIQFSDYIHKHCSNH